MRHRWFRDGKLSGPFRLLRSRLFRRSFKRVFLDLRERDFANERPRLCAVWHDGGGPGTNPGRLLTDRRQAPAAG
jgi:hypothetical protein